MRFTKKLTKYRGVVENVAFLVGFGFIMYDLISNYWKYIYDSIKGKGFFGAVIDSISTRHYYVGIVSILFIINASCLLWEILSLIVQLLKQEKEKKGYHKYRLIFKKLAVNYKPSFLSLTFYELLPKIFLIHVFWIWQPHLQKMALFTTNLAWYSWIYAFICWEFAAWIFHFSSHRVRLLWCLHAPHHSPSELNLTVNWVRFFAEAYFATFVHLFISVLLGVNPAMFVAIIAVETAWGKFVHVSEGTLKNGYLGVLQHLIITPAHHRVHHAKAPLYIDTNFANVVPIWDWMFGTLQPLKEEVRLDYGVTRDLDVTNFSDLYFGEILLLYRDVKRAKGIKNKLLYLVMPPGWTPAGTANTASAMRRDFLKTNPALAVTSRNRILDTIKSRSKNIPAQIERAEIPDSRI